jgi:hypothetical protein
MIESRSQPEYSPAQKQASSSLRSLDLNGLTVFKQVAQNSTPIREQIKHLGVKIKFFKTDTVQPVRKI